MLGLGFVARQAKGLSHPSLTSTPELGGGSRSTGGVREFINVNVTTWPDSVNDVKVQFKFKFSLRHQLLNWSQLSQNNIRPTL